MADEDVDMDWADYPGDHFGGYGDEFNDDFDDDFDYHFDHDFDDELNDKFDNEFNDESDIDLDDNEAYDEYPPSNPDSQIPAGGKECNICGDKCDDLTFMTPCQHEVCTECQKRAFRVAMRDEEAYPPLCCAITKFHIELAAQALDAQEFQAYRERVDEMDATERLYCAVPTCSKFIPSTAVDNEHGTCPQCGQRTHTVCQNLEHPGQECLIDAGVDVVLQMADEEGWQPCARCGNFIERTAGCNHMTCRCGYQFCWGCGKPMRLCNCMAAQQNGPGLIQQRLERLAAAHPDPRDDDEEDFMHYDRMMELAGVGNNLVGYLRGLGFDNALAAPGRCPDGQHAQWTVSNDGHLVCERCREITEHFVLECEACGLRVCSECRRFV